MSVMITLPSGYWSLVLLVDRWKCIVTDSLRRLVASEVIGRQINNKQTDVPGQIDRW